jgi:thioredoxin reductase (NADPH)
MNELPPNYMNDPIAFPKLSEAQIRALSAFGQTLKIKNGETVWAAGQPNICVFVVVSGTMTIYDSRTHTAIASHGPGNFSGDIDVITGRPAVVTAIASTDMELIEVPGDAVRTIVSERPEMGDVLLKAFLKRRALLQASGVAGVLVVGSRFDPLTLRLREFLVRSRYPMVWQDIESDPSAKQILDEFGVEPNDTPIVVLPRGDVLRRPTNAELGTELGTLAAVEGTVYDLVVVGAGPAGLAAAVYGASEGLHTLVVDGEGPGGQAGTSSRIENYMGFPFGISGQQLADGAVAQAERFGARFVAPAIVHSLSCGEAGLHDLDVEGVGKITTRCVILATGARYQALDVDRLEEFEGRGVYYAATNVERVLCGPQTVAVVGAGNSAGQAAVFLSETSKKVLLVVRGNDLHKTMSSYLALRIESLERDGRIAVMLETQICALHGIDCLEGVTLANKATGTKSSHELSAIFVMIGATPKTQWLQQESKVKLDEKGFVMTGNELMKRDLWKQSRAPFFLETSCPGVFAAGDLRSGSVKRVASAVGEGSMAVALVHQYLAL